MLLTAEQLRPFLFGAVETNLAEDGGLIPRKCTTETREKWAGLAPFLGDMADHTSGIRLDFTTFADRVKFRCGGGVFDLMIDGALTLTKDLTKTCGEICALLPDKGDPDPEDPNVPEKLTRVTLIFPTLTTGKVYSLEIPDDAILRRPEYGEKFLFLGDSITQGWNATSPSRCYAWRTALHYNADCILHGVGGGYFRPEIFEAPSGFEPDRVFVAFGTNDYSWGYSPEEVRAFTAAYLDRVKTAFAGKKIYCITPIWRDDAQYHGAPEAFRVCVDYIIKEEKARGFTVIDGGALVPHEEEYYTSDRLHPNDKGFEVYAENLISALERSEK